MSCNTSSLISPPVYHKNYHITSHHITSHHITSHHITSHHITSHHITSHHITHTTLHTHIYAHTHTHTHTHTTSHTLHHTTSHTLTTSHIPHDTGNSRTQGLDQRGHHRGTFNQLMTAGDTQRVNVSCVSRIVHA